jgi:hypothetical protein
MAHPIKAIAAYRPRIVRDTPAGSERYVDLTAARTTLSPGVIKNVQEAEVETLVGLLAEGRTVYTGTATYSPSIDLDGRIRVHVKVDRRILNALNAEGGFCGRIANRENVGKGRDDLVAAWNAAHPDDPVE